MSRLSIHTKDRAQITVESLYSDLERRIVASPPGLCSVDLICSFVKMCLAQLCGKCVPCRVGLDQLVRLFEDVLNGKADMETIDIIRLIAESIYQSADCAIGFEAARTVLKWLEGCMDDFESHIKEHHCTCNSNQPVPCVVLCPAGVDIPGYIALAAQERYADAVRLIRKDNPMPVTCAMICEHPCENRCKRTMIDAPVNIRGLKRVAVDMAGDVPIPEWAPSTGKKVAVIGGGPGGLSAAYYLSLMGHKVTIYEQRKQLGGMLRYGISREIATEKRLVGCLRKIGFDYIFDTNFAADLTIMEEENEFLQRLPEIKEKRLPMFTSCCPGWVNFLHTQYPQYVSRLLSAKSPQQMFGPIAKTYYAQLLGVEPSRIFVVSMMPCLSKKRENRLDGMDSAGTGRDVDEILTTREVARLLNAYYVKPETVAEEEFDKPLGVYTGAGVIFGTTGGVMEAALRTAYKGTNPDPDLFHYVRGLEGIKEAEIDINGTAVRIAVVSGLGNARKLMEQIDKGEKVYDFVEVMACPGGCINGGGQPIHEGGADLSDRTKVLYNLDKNNPIRFSHENPEIIECYQKFLEKPLSHKAHELLHVEYK